MRCPGCRFAQLLTPCVQLQELPTGKPQLRPGEVSSWGRGDCARAWSDPALWGADEMWGSEPMFLGLLSAWTIASVQGPHSCMSSVTPGRRGQSAGMWSACAGACTEFALVADSNGTTTSDGKWHSAVSLYGFSDAWLSRGYGLTQAGTPDFQPRLCVQCRAAAYDLLPLRLTDGGQVLAGLRGDRSNDSGSHS